MALACAKPSGTLTYDGVHPNADGVKLLANLIGDGIVRARPTGRALEPIPWPKSVEFDGRRTRIDEKLANRPRNLHAAATECDSGG